MSTQELARHAKEMTRQADRYARAATATQFFLWFKCGDIRINVEVDEKYYLAFYAETWGMAADITPPPEEYWWNQRYDRHIVVERGGWCE
jgi:hypothetical protein